MLSAVDAWNGLMPTMGALCALKSPVGETLDLVRHIHAKAMPAMLCDPES